MRTSVLWIIPFLSALFGYCSVRFFLTPKTIHAPLVCGMPLQDACTLLSHHNIPLQIIQYKIDPTMPDNTIIHQTPAAHQAIRPHQTIFLTLSQKPKAQRAPDCHQKHIDAIKELCYPLGIKLQSHSLKAPFCKRTCFAQYPAANKGLDHQSLIIYTSSDQPDPIIWPNFIGRPLEEVIQFLNIYAITPHITYNDNQHNNNHSNNVIVDQRPLAGSLIDFREEKKPVVQLKIGT